MAQFDPDRSHGERHPSGERMGVAVCSGWHPLRKDVTI